QVHRTDADALSAQVQEQLGGGSVPREDRPTREEFDALVQSLEGGDLALGVGESMNLRKPAAQLLLDGDDGGSSVFARGQQAVSKPKADGRTVAEFRDA